MVQVSSEEVRKVSNATQTVIVVGDNFVTLSFTPPEVEKLVMGNRDKVLVMHWLSNLDSPDTGVLQEDNVISLRAESDDQSVAMIRGNDTLTLTLSPDSPSGLKTNDSFFTVEGDFLGRTFLRIFAKAKQGVHIPYSTGTQQSDPTDPDAAPARNQPGAMSTHFHVDIPTTDKANLASEWTELDVQYKVAVIREDRALDTIFIAVIVVLLLFANVGMGCKIDLKVVKEVLRRPIAPTIGFCCQFIVMPLVRLPNTFSLPVPTSGKVRSCLCSIFRVTLQLQLQLQPHKSVPHKLFCGTFFPDSNEVRSERYFLIGDK